MVVTSTVRSVPYDLLRTLGLSADGPTVIVIPTKPTMNAGLG